ncbi:MAG: hypothetical protein M3070_07840 [Actinomycetota bacterium]|nr:hypothetical protein [Actinomycetota bacterium]
MTSSLDAAIVPVTLTVNGRIGLTLWAPPWEDDDGEQWQGFLGDGSKILLYPTVRELAGFIMSGEENDLTDHPAWGHVLKLTPDHLRPGGEDTYDLDAVYDWASGEPDPVHVSALADVVDMVAKIADCCDDGALRRLVEDTPEYAELVGEDVSYQGKDGRKRWNDLGDVIADTWERAIARVESWLSWQGEFSSSDLDAETVWDRVGAEPIRITLPDADYLTVRGYLADDTQDEPTAVFLGDAENIAVFTEIADLARYCRVADDHELMRLEWWSELAEIEDDEVFAPGLDATYDLRKPTTAGTELLRELIAFCDLELDTSVLDEPNVNRDDWRDLLEPVRTCLKPQD